MWLAQLEQALPTHAVILDVIGGLSTLTNSLAD